MAGTCPQGHESTWDDFCSVCGDTMPGTGAGTGSSTDGGSTAAPIGSAAEADAAASAPTAGACPNCATGYGPEDVFCENCGYDFATGTLPTAEADPAAGADAAASAAPAAPAPAAGTPNPAGSQAASTGQAAPAGWTAEVRCDRAYFDEIVGDADLDYPDPEPPVTRIALTGGKILIGRLNSSRGVYPEIDLDALTGDPASSTRHAMLRSSDNGWTVTDLGSTNGTSHAPPDSSASEMLSPGDEIPVASGAVLRVGAWTRITVRGPATDEATDPAGPDAAAPMA